MLLVRSVGLWHGHSTYNTPIVSGPEPRMRDPDGIRRSIAIAVQPLKRYPVTRDRDVRSHLNRGGFEFTGGGDGGERWPARSK
jgi:hypothetical protein